MKLPTWILRTLKKSVPDFILKHRRLKDYVAMSGAEILLRPIQMLKEYLVARFLGPADYGLLKSLELINMLRKYGSLGYRSVATREAGSALGEGDVACANRLRGAAYAGEVVLTSVLALIALGSIVFVDRPRLSVLMLLATLTFITSKLGGLFQTESVIRKEFKNLARVKFAAGLVASLIVICFVAFWGIYVVILTQFFVALVTIIAFVKYLDYRLPLDFDYQEIKRLTKIGIPLSLNVIALGAFKYSERLLILGSLGTDSLGLYSLAQNMSVQSMIFYSLMEKVRSQDIFELLGEHEYRRVNEIVLRETAFLIGTSIAIYPLFYLGVELLIPLLLPEWSEAIPYAEWLYWLVPLQISTMYPCLVLRSNQVDEQAVIPSAQFISVGILYALFALVTTQTDFTMYHMVAGVLSATGGFVVIIGVWYYRKFVKRRCLEQ